MYWTRPFEHKARGEKKLESAFEVDVLIDIAIPVLRLFMQHKTFRWFIDNSNRHRVECWAAKREMLISHIRYLFPYQDILEKGVNETLQEGDDASVVVTHGCSRDKRVLRVGDLVFIENDDHSQSDLARITKVTPAATRVVDVYGTAVTSNTFEVETRGVSPRRILLKQAAGLRPGWMGDAY